MANINDDFFNGHYKEIWKTLIPAELTVREVDFMVPHFGLQPGSRVLDLMCGYGRHALALGRKGIAVTAVDNLRDYTDEIRETVLAEALPVEVICTDVLGFRSSQQFDLAICMGNSLNFFTATEIAALLAAVGNQLKPGGHLLINSWSITEIQFNKTLNNSWSRIGEYTFLSSARLLFQPTRLEVETITLRGDGISETKKGIDYIYSLNELEALLQEAGLRLTEAYSIPGKKKFTLGEPRVYLVAEKA
ncbi:MAG: methyltransferase domain-containing protein [Sphingobacteriales bacterium]|nr:methyltransferase domain-containing protein [Sphingobacteriales bacterium]